LKFRSRYHPGRSIAPFDARRTRGREEGEASVGEGAGASERDESSALALHGISLSGERECVGGGSVRRGEGRGSGVKRIRGNRKGAARGGGAEAEKEKENGKGMTAVKGGTKLAIPARRGRGRGEGEREGWEGRIPAESSPRRLRKRAGWWMRGRIAERAAG